VASGAQRGGRRDEPVNDQCHPRGAEAERSPAPTGGQATALHAPLCHLPCLVPAAPLISSSAATAALAVECSELQLHWASFGELTIAGYPRSL
jgi:hypothetical protein